MVTVKGNLGVNKESCEPLPKCGSLDPRVVGLLMGVLAFVAPFEFHFDEFYDIPYLRITALMYGLWLGTTGCHIEIYGLDPWAYMLPSYTYVLVIRILFAFQMVRYYQGKTTRMLTLVWGVVADLGYTPTILLENLWHFIFGFYEGIINVPVPIPVLLVVCTLLNRFFPAPPERIWDSVSDTEES